MSLLRFVSLAAFGFITLGMASVSAAQQRVYVFHGEPVHGQARPANRTVQFVVESPGTRDNTNDRQPADAAPGRASAGQAFTARVEIKPGGPWLGVMCHPVDDFVKRHLQIEHGLVVDHVLPGTAADQGGIARYDVLLAYNDQPLRKIEDLLEAVKDSGDKEVDVALIRAGRRTVVKVRPGKRPEEHADFHFVPPQDRDLLRRWVDDLGNQFAVPAKPFQFRMIRPGVVLPDTMTLRSPKAHPKGLEITITKTDESPAKVVVKKGETTYQTTADKLDDLPEDVRVHAQQLLGKNWTNLKLEHFDRTQALPDRPRDRARLPEGDIEVRPIPDMRLHRPHMPPPADARTIDDVRQEMQQRMDEMQRFLDEMRKRFDESSRPTAPNAPDVQAHEG